MPKTPPKPPTTSAAAAQSRQRSGPGVKSKEARSVALNLLDAPRDLRRQWLHTLSETDRSFVFGEVERETGTLYGLWYDAPVGFTEDVIGETVWGLQGEVLDSLALDTVQRIIVPAGFGVGKTYIAGRAAAWAVATNVIGSMVVVTTAPKMRQVRSQMWPHIKTAVAKGRLPGRTDTTQWIVKDALGNDVQAAYGFSAAPTDEAAMQGIHGKPKLLLIVDEAGGISPLIGNGTNNLLTGDAKLIAIGNPAMNEPGSWFERSTVDGNDAAETETHTIQISTLDSPSITGAPTPICRACVPNLDNHTISGGLKPHLPDWSWLRKTLRDYGIQLDPDCTDLDEVRRLCRESGQPYLIAKVLAEFPKDTGNQVMPASWVEAAMLAEEPLDHTGCGDSVCNGGTSPEVVCVATMLAEDYVRLCDLGIETETDTFAVKKGAWVRLGVDVAADGGDEFAVYRSIGDMLQHRHTSSGAQNADPMVVADKIVDQIDAANKVRSALGTAAKVRVKVDANGLGWGVVGVLQGYVKSGRIDAEIIGVMVSESPETEDEASPMRPYRKRDELWLAGRHLLQPDPKTGYGRVRLRTDQKCATQLTHPRLGNNSGGYVLIESKDSMRRRGMNSPDRAEAALLALYEPLPIHPMRRKGILGGSS